MDSISLLDNILQMFIFENNQDQDQDQDLQENTQEDPQDDPEDSENSSVIIIQASGPNKPRVGEIGNRISWTGQSNITNINSTAPVNILCYRFILLKKQKQYKILKKKSTRKSKIGVNEEN